ncbi:hypothetical protein Pmani_019656 [Petrolisthes manimaculis]|uniref:C-Jun-amino-terminal kinase-interacting protein 4 n=1 Tax=Petrolisthes manimaculis TaxID=1843537 RepID=A0AAE1U3C1_9EUCA|nr:hypothetical protein Pmani_019656 [Petrolisthes manimaculis]
MDGETVYNSHDDSHIVMSEKVQSLAGSIYQEFERMIGRYDEDVVKDLMPLVVNILEGLDLAYTENQEHEVEVELLREDNEQLVTQYEREKQLRKGAEQKLLEVEDGLEEERKQGQGRVETLESIVRMLELKNRNASDHANRMEDKSEELKREYSKLHERYTELFKTHMDYLERTKILMGTDRLDQLLPGQGGAARNRMSGFSLGRSSGPVSFGFSSLEGRLGGGGSPSDLPSGPIPATTAPTTHHNAALSSELQEAQVGPDTPVVRTDKEGGWVEGFSGGGEDVSSPELDMDDLSPDTPSLTRPRPTTTTHKEERTGNTLYQELQFQEPDALAEMDEGADITDSGSEEGGKSPAYSVTDNFFGMGKEVENLILENNELLATKNALNIVKDDLIVKVDELTSQQEILREEIKSLNTVKSRLKLRVTELEDELKRVKEEAEKNARTGRSDDEDVPMAQRKRFTRVEMARVLMERNQYKERFMELQEAVRWTEMIRATRPDGNVDKKNKQTIWKFFSNLFSTTEKPPRKVLPYGHVRYSAPAGQVTPALDTMRRRNLSDHRRKGLEIFDAGLDNPDDQNQSLTYLSPSSSSPPLTPTTSSSEKLQQRRATERREQYKQVRAHVKKDDGRMQAYGWSLPAKTGQRAIEGSSGSQGASQPTRSGTSHLPVPVPVYCRPLMEKEPGMKIWCAAGVNLTGGRTRDGGSIVGASVFYSGDAPTPTPQPKDDIDRLDLELKEQEKEQREGETLEQTLSSLVWICTSTHSISKVTVIDANNPADILESFHVCSSHLLCIASVPGAKESDYTIDEDLNKLVEESQKKQQQQQQQQDNCDITGDEKVGERRKEEESEDSNKRKEEEAGGERRNNKEEGGGTSMGTLSFISCGAGSEVGSPGSPSDKEPEEIRPVLTKETITCTDPDQDEDRAEAVEGGNSDVPVRRLLKEPQGVVKDGVEEAVPTSPEERSVVVEEVEKMSSVLSTMWLGSQSGSLYVHSAVRHWKRCLHSIKLKDSVLSIVHVKGRVLAALADGTVAIFHRGGDGQWDLTNYHLLDLGKPHHSIRCMAPVRSRVWCGYRNKIHVIDPRTMTVEKTFDAHPRKESQVRQMAWVGDGVWVSIRLDSTLRLYHAHTHQHLQDVDIEPYVSKMLGTGKLGFSFVRITALLISSNRLWIGTGNGVIISVPLSDTDMGLEGSTTKPPTNTATTGSSSSNTRTPGGVVRVYSDGAEGVVAGGSYAPYCSMAQAQLSFHGHRDAVKFFVAVPGSGGYHALTAAPPASPPTRAIKAKGEEGENDGEEEGGSESEKPKNMLVISGGEGYIDFRIGEGEDDTAPEPQAESLSRGDRSHLIVWSVARPPV